MIESSIVLQCLWFDCLKRGVRLIGADRSMWVDPDRSMLLLLQSASTDWTPQFHCWCCCCCCCCYWWWWSIHIVVVLLLLHPDCRRLSVSPLLFRCRWFKLLSSIAELLLLVCWLIHCCCYTDQSTTVGCCCYCCYQFAGGTWKLWQIGKINWP